jgi:hypothetical protein
MKRLSFIALGIYAIALPSVALSAAPTCDCWQTEDQKLIFTNYKSVDFRSLSAYAGPVPPVIDDPNVAKTAPATSEFFQTPEWTGIFTIQGWEFQYPSVKLVNSKNNVYLQTAEDSSTYLTLRTQRNADFQSAAEFNTISDDYTAASLRILSRAHGDAGGCAGMFTFAADDDGTQHEQDIEILTHEAPGRVKYSTHPEEEASDWKRGSIEGTVPNVQTMGWIEYRMDWTEPTTTFYGNGLQNGQLAHEFPQVPSYLCFNARASGNEHWEKTMAVGGSAYMDIQLIEIAYNTSESEDAACASFCNLS